MALKKLDRSFVILRFKFGKSPYKARQRTEDTTRYLISRVALNYAGDLNTRVYETKEAIETDLLAEVARQTQLYRKIIIGAPGTNTTPTGTLTTVAAGGPTQNISGLVEWKKRNRQYLARKRKKQGGIPWFTREGWTGVGGGKVLPTFATADNWLEAFGEISVDFNKRSDVESQVDASLRVGGGKTAKATVGEMRIRALGKITPDMLPGLANGGAVANLRGNPGLMGLVANVSPGAAKRLGNMKNGTYRPTLEPFLTFFLTQSLQHAVNTRLAAGGIGRSIRAGNYKP